MDNTQGRPPFDAGSPTHGFPAFQPGPQPPYPNTDPRFLAPPATPRRGKAPIVLAAILGGIVALVLGLVIGITTNRDEGPSAAAQPLLATGQPGGASSSAAAAPSAVGEAPAPGGGAGFDLRKGGVFLQSNDPNGNEVVAFARSEDGTTHEVGRYKTGGTGSGSFEDTAHGIVLGTPDGEASPQQNLDSAQLLFVVNAGSNTITEFRVDADGLELVKSVPSGGEKPVSLTVSHGHLYALNSGELDDRFVLRFPDQFLDNCTHGEQPTVSGFRISALGDITPIVDSARALSGGQRSGCAQISFTPDGTKLMVTERLASLPQKTPDHGAFVTFDVSSDGTLGAKKVQDSAGTGPFGFSFTKDGTVLVTDQNHADPGKGSASSYTMLSDGTLKAISKAVPNGQSDTCWIEPTADGKLAFASNALGDGTVSSYRIDDTGALTLLHGSATAPNGGEDHLQSGTLDSALSRDSKYFYQLNSHFGYLESFRVNADGTLTFLQQHKVFNVTLPENGGQLPPFGISAF